MQHVRLRTLSVCATLLVGIALALTSGGLPAMAGEIPVVSPAMAGLSESKLKEVDQFMQRQITDQKLAGGIVMIGHRGQIGFVRAYGQMDIAAQKPMETDTIVRIYSMSKAITTAAALALQDAGKLSLDDPVSKYIPSFAKLQVAAPEGPRPPKRPMTVRDLMLHTSGITYGGGPDAVKEAYGRVKPMEAPNLEEMAERFSKVPLAYDPGTDWIYSASVDVLGRVIEVASGEPLDVYLKKTIFDPLEMVDTAFEVPAEKLPRFAANYTRADGGLKVIDVPQNSKYAKKVTMYSGGGGLVGTAGDYMRFLMMVASGGELNGKRVLKPETVLLMTTNQLPKEAFPIRFGEEIRHGTGFGLGFSVRTEITTWDPAGHVGEYGWEGAASTHYWVSPKDNLIVVTLEQTMPYQWDTEFGLKPVIYNALEN